MIRTRYARHDRRPDDTFETPLLTAPMAVPDDLRKAQGVPQRGENSSIGFLMGQPQKVSLGGQLQSHLLEW